MVLSSTLMTILVVASSQQEHDKIVVKVIQRARIQNCIFMGVRGSALRHEMLQTQDLTLEKACKLGRLAETSTQQL
ncbi:hypothetical protein PR048_019831 [Dryococelus australis]|uniref:Uncharacterized protein n=1 Tax=Dryococelus australis TaxID=614101 RepID=A0ABQ9H4K3_9NEOP|nr:hypothetical protein PR048_019831 [Dryococelus australis]